MKISLITKIELLAKGIFPNWVHSGDVEAFAMSENYKASHGDRRARDLVAQGILERVKEGVSVKYRYVPPELRKVEAKERSESPPKEMKKFWQRVNQETKPVQFAEPFKKVVITNQQLF